MIPKRETPFLSGNLQWKFINSLHATTHLGEKALQRLLERPFRGTDFQTTIRQVVSSCPTCQLNNPQGTRRPQLAQPVQQRGTYPGEDWQMDFTQMPVSQGYKYLLVMIDTFTGWIEGISTQTEKPEEVIKKLFHEIIPRFGLPRSLQSDNGTSFTSKVTQGVSKALGITNYLHCAWGPQSSGKVERANQFLKSAIKVITQETSLGCKEALPIALLHTHITPKEQVGLSPYEMLYGRPFVYVNDLFLDPEAQTLWSYTMAIGQFQKDIHIWGVNQDPKDSKEPPLYAPGTQDLIKVWEDGSPKALLQPTWKGPFPVILSTPTAVKVPGHKSWILYSQAMDENRRGHSEHL